MIEQLSSIIALEIMTLVLYGGALQFWWIITVQLLSLLKNTILCETWTIDGQQMAKMNDRVPSGH